MESVNPNFIPFLCMDRKLVIGEHLIQSMEYMHSLVVGVSASIESSRVRAVCGLLKNKEKDKE